MVSSGRWVAVRRWSAARLWSAATVATLALVVLAPVGAEVTTRVTVEATNSLVLGLAELAAGGLGSAELDFQSAGSRDVRSRVQLRAEVVDAGGRAAAVLTVPRAEIRWRQSVGEELTLRFTVGRSRLSWGDGAVYNAGDLINGAVPATLNLGAATLRDETQWLIAGYVPLGRFGFAEPIVLLPAFDIALDPDANPATPPPFPAATAVGAGARVQLPLGPLKAEAAYLYRGDAGIHRPSLSLQGNLIADLYAGGSLAVDTTLARTATTAGEIVAALNPTVSGGALYTGNNPRLGSWTARVEGLWVHRAPLLAGTDRLKAFVELTWAPSQLLALFVRGDGTVAVDGRETVSDGLDGTSALGVSWTPTTGLTLLLLGTISGGADVPPLPGAGDVLGTVSAIVRYVF